MSEVPFKRNGRVYRASGDPEKPRIWFGGIEVFEPPSELLAAAKHALEEGVVILLEDR